MTWVPDPARRPLKLEEWPEADRWAWQEALREGDVLAPGGIASEWASLTRLEVAKSYGRWLAWLGRNALLDPSAPLAERITPDRISRYVADLKASYAPYTVVIRVQQLHAAHRAMAPEGDWHWLMRLKQRLVKRAVSVKNKRSRVVAADQLLALGHKLMAEAQAGSDLPGVGRAALYRDGLMIALLTLRPFRNRNFASITIGQHLIRRGDGYWLCFEAEETKNRIAIEVPFPDALVPHLERYLDYYRPVLATDSGRRKSRKRTAYPPTLALWVSRDRTPMGRESVYEHIVNVTRERLGRAINPHLFRDCAATTIAAEDPLHVQITRNILGHTSLATSERYYNQARSLSAFRTYQREVHARRSGATRGSTT